MTSYKEILEAMEVPIYEDSVKQLKSLAAKTLTHADSDVRLFITDHFNHSYLPDFVLRWPKRPDRQDRLVYLRASAYAEEIEEDVIRLADRHPLFVQLSEFHPFTDRPIRPAIEELDRSASAAKTLVTTMPAIGYLDDSPRTGGMLSSFVMRGGKGVIEDSEAQAIANRVEAGFDGAMSRNREATKSALDAVEEVLDPASTAEFNHLFEAAWISSQAPATEFPGGVTSIGEDLSSALLAQLLDIVPESLDEFWEQIGKAVTLDSFAQLHLVAQQPRLQSILKHAVTRLQARKCSIRRTQRADQTLDPFLWQVENGVLSLRGGGYQAWIGSPPARLASDSGDEFSTEAAPSLSKLATRSQDARLTITDINVLGQDQIAVRFMSPGDGDVATSDLLERVAESLEAPVELKDVVALTNGTRVTVDYGNATAGTKTKSRVAVSSLVWNGWNLLAETTNETRSELQLLLGSNGADPTDAFDETDDSPAEDSESREAGSKPAPADGADQTKDL